MSCLLVVSNDQATTRALEQYMVFQGHFVLTATDLRGLIRTLQQWRADVLVLDVMWSQEKDQEVQATLRACPSLEDTPIIFLTWTEAGIRRLLRPGRDDCLVKPVHLGHLEEKVLRILGHGQRRPGQRSKRTLHCGPLTLDPATLQVTMSDRPVSLTPTEFALLRHLMGRAGEVVAIGELLEAVWECPAELGSPELVRVHIKNLRRKLEGDANGDFRFIKTVPRHGYLVPAEPGLPSTLSAA